MSKYNNYAKELDKAFKAAREEYKAIVDRLVAAERAKDAAEAWFAEKYIGERAFKKAKAQAELSEAQNEIKTAGARIWENFDNTKRNIGARLFEEIKKDNLATPDDIDPAGIELLKSGILSAEDMTGLASKYDNNPTMLRIISTYAQNAAEAHKDDRESKHAFMAIHNVTKDGLSSAARNWDTLSTMADRCAGVSRVGSLTSAPKFVASMNRHWEEVSSNVVEGF